MQMPQQSMGMQANVPQLQPVNNPNFMLPGQGGAAGRRPPANAVPEDSSDDSDSSSDSDESGKINYNQHFRL